METTSSLERSFLGKMTLPIKFLFKTTPKKIMKTSATVHRFSGINPINYVTEVLRVAGVFASFYDFITASTVPLSQVDGEKDVYLACFEETIQNGHDEYVELLRQEGLQPCGNPNNYLLGLAVQVSQREMPSKLRYKNMVAVEPNPLFKLRNSHGVDSYLAVLCSTAGRVLGLPQIDTVFRKDCAFIAEKLVI